MDLIEKTDIQLVEIIEEDYIDSFKFAASCLLKKRLDAESIVQFAIKYHTQKIRTILLEIGITNFDELDIPESKLLSNKEMKIIFEKEFNKHLIRRKEFYDNSRII